MLLNRFEMNTYKYTYDDFLVYSLSYFGLSGIVEKKLITSTMKDELYIKHVLDVMNECNEMDLSDRAKHFRFLYKRFCIKNKLNKDQLISDMLNYCG
jgi:hypothetical protein